MNIGALYFHGFGFPFRVTISLKGLVRAKISPSHAENREKIEATLNML